MDDLIDKVEARRMINGISYALDQLIRRKIVKSQDGLISKESAQSYAASLPSRERWTGMRYDLPPNAAQKERETSKILYGKRVEIEAGGEPYTMRPVRKLTSDQIALIELNGACTIPHGYDLVLSGYCQENDIMFDCVNLTWRPLEGDIVGRDIVSLVGVARRINYSDGG